MTLLRDTSNRLPLDATKPSRALLLAFYADPEPYPGEDLERELKSRFDSVTTLRADTRFINAAGLKLPSPDSYDVAILALFVRVSDRKGNVDIPAEQAALAEQVFKTGKPVITVAFGSPYLIERFPQAETWLAAFGISDVAQISIARALFGQIPVRGQVPVTIPGVNLKAGFGISHSRQSRNRFRPGTYFGRHRICSPRRQSRLIKPLRIKPSPVRLWLSATRQSGCTRSANSATTRNERRR